MRSQILRDVVAGCAGMLAVIAIIGLPSKSATSSVQTNNGSTIRACLLPVYSSPRSKPASNIRVCPVVMPIGPRLVAPAQPAVPGPLKTP
jgi:hypothetical protein